MKGADMQHITQSSPLSTTSIPLEDFGQLQARYQSLPLTGRASAVLKDAAPALQTAEDILKSLADSHNIKLIFAKIRKNASLTGKMRPSDARDLLMDNGSDFIDGTRRKLAAWQKTLERISNGEDIVSENDREYIPIDAPVALAIAGTSQVSNYLSIIQLALMELSKSDAKNSDKYRDMMSGIRRCATVLSDCENASDISKAIH